MPETTRSPIIHVVSDEDTSRRIITDSGDTETNIGSDAFPMRRSRHAPAASQPWCRPWPPSTP